MIQIERSQIVLGEFAQSTTTLYMIVMIAMIGKLARVQISFQPLHYVQLETNVDERSSGHFCFVFSPFC
jgi:hypothetical protein